MSRISYHPFPFISTICGFILVLATVASASDRARERLDHGDHIHGLYPDKEHVVVRGDTLWDLSGSYLEDPFIWPDIWQVNPQITHPDLIYPGDSVHLPGEQKAAASPTGLMPSRQPASPLRPLGATVPEGAEIASSPSAPKVIVEGGVIDRTGWIASADEEVGIGTILGSWHGDRWLLSTDAAVYLSFGAREGVVAGDRFQIVNTERIVRHPRTDEVVGRLVKVVGQVEVTQVGDTTAMGKVVACYLPIKAGDAVMPVPTSPPLIESPARDEAASVEAVVLASYDDRFSLAVEDVIYLDVGNREEIHAGDRFHLVRNVGGDKFTRYSAEAVVVSTQESTCTALITRSLTEAFVGDQAAYATNPLPDIYHQ